MSVAHASDFVEKRTDFKNQVHAVLDKKGVSYDWDPFSVEGREILAGVLVQDEQNPISGILLAYRR